MIKANDVVLHKPTGETWVACGVHKDGKTLIPCGWPFPRIAKISDCELLEQRNMPQTFNQICDLRFCGLVGYIDRTGEEEATHES